VPGIGLGTKRALKLDILGPGRRDLDHLNERDDAVPTMQRSLQSEMFSTVSMVHYWFRAPSGDSPLPGPQLQGSQQYFSSRAAESGDGRPLLEAGCPAPANPWAPKGYRGKWFTIQ